jgi:hypothetical protein
MRIEPRRFVPSALAAWPMRPCAGRFIWAGFTRARLRFLRRAEQYLADKALRFLRDDRFDGMSHVFGL